MVLQSMGKGAKTGVIKVFLLSFLFLAVAGLVMTDVQGFFRGGLNTDTVAKGGGIRIGTMEFDRTVRRVLASQGLTTQQAYELGLIDQILQSEIQGLLMAKQARDLGLSVGDDTVLAQIATMAEPYASDELSKGQALQLILRSQGINEDEFVADVRREMALGLLRGTLTSGGNAVPEDMVKALYASENETRTVEAIVFSPKDVTDVAEPSDENLQSYYEANRLNYAIPATRRVTLGFLGEAQVKAQMGEEDRAGDLQQLLMDTANQMDDMLASGEAFDTVVKEYSLTTQKIGPFRTTGFNDAQKNLFEAYGTDGGRIIDAAFDTPLNDSAPVMELADGRYVVVHVDAETPIEYRPYEAVKAELKTKWLAEQRALLNRERAQAALTHASQGAGFAEIAESNGAAVQTISGLKRTTDNNKILTPIAVSRMFSAGLNEAVTAESGEAIVLARVTGVTPADSAKADAEALEAIRQRLAQEQAQELLQSYLVSHSSRGGVRVNQTLLRQMYGGTDQTNSGMMF